MTSAADVRSSFVRRNGLAIVTGSIFLLMLLGQIFSGWTSNNSELQSHGEDSLPLLEYLTTGHFWEAIFENWESEFFQMFSYVWLTARFFQLGSPESKSPGGEEAVDEDPMQRRNDADAPPIVRNGSKAAIWLYSHSLSLTFITLWLLSFLMHAFSGAREFSSEQTAHGESAVTMWTYMTSSQFWFESFQNYQSEFMVLAVLLVASMYLREKGSPESKPVHASHRSAA